eukprot:11560517-Heterocapsa_arctica.AAC.1
MDMVNGTNHGYDPTSMLAPDNKTPDLISPDDQCLPAKNNRRHTSRSNDPEGSQVIGPHRKGEKHQKDNSYSC